MYSFYVTGMLLHDAYVTLLVLYYRYIVARYTYHIRDSVTRSTLQACCCTIYIIYVTLSLVLRYRHVVAREPSDVGGRAEGVYIRLVELDGLDSHRALPRLLRSPDTRLLQGQTTLCVTLYAYKCCATFNNVGERC